MKNDKVNPLLQKIAGIDPYFFCLFLALGLEFLLMSFRGYSFYFLDNYALVPCMLFLGIGLTRKETFSRWQLWLGLAAAVWFFIAQMLHQAMDMDVRNPGLFFSVYLMAFPFAAMARDGQKQLGLKMAAVAYIAAAMVLTIFTGLLMLDALPGFLRPHVSWDGARLQAMWHPNICASIFMIAIAFCLGLSSLAEKKWAKALLLALAGVFFGVMALTNSRTSILMTCALMGGFAFFSIFKGGWKRFLAGGLAAIVLMAALFLASGKLFDFHNDRLLDKYTDSQTAGEALDANKGSIVTDSETGEAELKADAVQGSLSQDLRTLNGRTVIWSSALQAIREDPSILIWGVDYTGSTLSLYNPFTVAHAHNSWVETLLGLGIPGVLFALVFTLFAAQGILRTLLNMTGSLWSKTIALLLLCLLGAAILEPYLFLSDRYYHYADFIFFLGIGYLVSEGKPTKYGL